MNIPSNRFDLLQQEDGSVAESSSNDVKVLGVDQISRGVDFTLSPTKILKSLCDAKPTEQDRFAPIVEPDHFEKDVLDDREYDLFENAIQCLNNLGFILDAVKGKSSKRVTEQDFIKLDTIQDNFYEFISTIKEKFIFAKLGASEAKGQNVDPILEEIKKINTRIAALEGNLVRGEESQTEVSSDFVIPTSSPPMSFAGKVLATSSYPISAPTLGKCSPLKYGNQLFKNSIIFENVLNIDGDISDEENLIDAFLNFINDRLNGVLPPLDKALVLKVTPISSKANSYLVSFHNIFDAQHIIDSSFYFSNSNLKDEDRIFVYPLLSPSEKKHQQDVLKIFYTFQTKDLSSNKYNFRIYPCGYDLKIKMSEKVFYFKLSDDEVRKNVSDDKVRSFLVDEVGVTLQ